MTMTDSTQGFNKLFRPLKRYAAAQRMGQARLPEYPYFGLPWLYDYTIPFFVEVYGPALVVAAYPEKNADGTPHAKAGYCAPYLPDVKVAAGSTTTLVKLESVSWYAVGVKVKIGGEVRTITTVDRTGKAIVLDSALPDAPAAGDVLSAAELSEPIGVIVESQDLELDANCSVQLTGAWDLNVLPLSANFDSSNPDELRKLNARPLRGILMWNLTLPTIPKPA